MSKHQCGSRKDMPKAREIREFWAAKLLALGKIADTEQALHPIAPDVDIYQCFNCGDAKVLDRAHIMPLALGGDNTAANLHMLCRVCHTVSERFSGEAYWRWFLAYPWRCYMDPYHSRDAFIAAGYSGMAEAAAVLGARYAGDPVRLKEEVANLMVQIAHARGAISVRGESEAQTAGIARAKHAGKYKGRKPTISRAEVVRMLQRGDTPTEIARTLRISRPSVYRIADEAGIQKG